VRPQAAQFYGRAFDGVGQVEGYQDGGRDRENHDPGQLDTAHVFFSVAGGSGSCLWLSRKRLQLHWLQPLFSQW
jgi:hypothetical protein